MKREIYYDKYLHLDELLNSQHLISASEKNKKKDKGKSHDEMLFIIVHQVYELWFKQILYELDSIKEFFARDYLNDRDLCIIVKRFNRILEIQKVLLNQFNILETMTPLEFLDFRKYLGQASGFESVQFRLLEITFGVYESKKSDSLFNFMLSRLSPENQEKCLKLKGERNLCTLIDHWLARMPFLNDKNYSFWQSYQKMVAKMFLDEEEHIKNLVGLNEKEILELTNSLNENRKQFDYLFDEKKYEELILSGQKKMSLNATKSALFILLYSHEPLLQFPARIIEQLIDIDEFLTLWRYRHSMVAHRMIGTKVGTGGSTGHQYLTKMAQTQRIFSDFFDLSTFLIPKTYLGPLPEFIEKKLTYSFDAK